MRQRKPRPGPRRPDRDRYVQLSEAAFCGANSHWDPSICALGSEQPVGETTADDGRRRGDAGFLSGLYLVDLDGEPRLVAAALGPTRGLLVSERQMQIGVRIPLMDRRHLPWTRSRDGARHDR